MTVIWALTDDRAGNISQVLGIAERLGLPFLEKYIRYNALGALPTCLLGKHLWSVSTETKRELTGPWPDLLISAGRRTVPIARFIKHKSPSCFWVQCMWPGLFAAKSADLVVVPEHDLCPPLPNLISTRTVPHRVTRERLNQEVFAWQNTLLPLSMPFVSWLIGGPAPHGEMDADLIVDATEKLIQATKEMGGTILVSTSRRTPDVVVSRVQETLARRDVPYVFYAWKSDMPNPYMAFLGASERIVVTGDSMSMCSEAAATGVPVYIVTPGQLPEKHHRLHQALYAANSAKPFPGSLEPYVCAPLDATEEVVKKIRLQCAL